MRHDSNILGVNNLEQNKRKSSYGLDDLGLNY